MTTMTAAESTARYMALWTTDELRNMRANAVSDNLRDGITREIERREATTIPAPRTAVVVEVVETVPCAYDGEPVATEDLPDHTIPGACSDCHALYVKD